MTGAFLVLAAPAARAATCTVPNAISNGQPADATKIMDNFNAVADCAEAAVAPTGSPSTGAVAIFSGPNSVTSGNLSGDVTTAGGTVTTLSNTAVTPGSYLSANIVVDAKGRITAATNGAGGGGGSWSLIYSNAAISNPTSSITVDVSLYNDVMIIGRGVTAASNGYRGVQVSVDGGSTFYKTNGDYETLPATGAVSANFTFLNHGTATTAARSFGGTIQGLRISGAPKFGLTAAMDINRWFVGSYNPITHIRIAVLAGSGGADINMTGGEVYVFAR